MDRYNLISSKDFGKTLKDKSDKDYRFLRDKYDLFLEQPLTLSMFVPCGDDGEVLGEPMSYKKYLNVSNTMSGSDILLCQQYQQAKERCLFEGFEAVNDELINNGVLFWVGKFDGKETIENCISSNLTLTQSAINQITTTR